MNNLLRFLVCSAAIVLAVCGANAQTVVYSNMFPGVGGLGPIPGGSPSAAFVSSSGSSDAAPGSFAAMAIGGPAGSMVLTDNQLASYTSVAPVPSTTNNGYAYAIAPMSVYTAPFVTTLTGNTQLVTWTFNIRTGAAASGFGPGQNEAAVVLASDNADIRSLGNGYAVIYNPAVSLSLQLVRFSGGLTGAVTPLVTSGLVMSAPTDYMSVRVVYNPVADSWELYLRDDGAGAFADPSTGVSTLVGGAVDAVFTGTAMSFFGFYSNYSVTFTGSGPDALNAYFDSYTVSTSCPDITGGLSTCVTLSTDLDHIFPGGVWTSGSTAIATVNPVTGLVTGVSAGTAEITYTVGTCEVTAIVTVNPTPIPPAITGTMTVCEGSTTSLSVTPATGGSTWSSSTPAIGTVSTTGVVTGVTGGTTMITYRVPTGCFSTAVVTVNPVSPILGYPGFCEGEIRTMITTIPGGTWSTSTVGEAFVDPSTGEVTGITTGTTTLSYILPTGCYSTTTLTVNITPGPITGTPTVCVGAGTPLVCTPGGGFWSSSDDFVASVSSTGVLVGNAVGTAIITYKLTSGCQSELTVTVNAQPGPITGGLNVCVGQTSALASDITGGAWSTAFPSLVGTIDPTSGVFTGLSAGTINVTYMMPTGCFRVAMATVAPLPAPITGVGSLCVGATTPLSSIPAPSGGGTWQSSDIAIGTVNSATGLVGGISAGTVNISIVATSTGCVRSTIVTVNPLPATITGSATVCTGRTTALGSTSTGGTWTSSDATVGTIDATSGVVDGLTTGTTTIVYTLGTGCTTSLVVTVLASPAAITGIPFVCVGQTTTLANATPGGTWSSSTPANGTVNPSTGDVAGITAGTTLISYTTTNGCFATRTVTVGALPTGISGTLTVCENAQTSLSGSPGFGTWSSSNTAIFTVSGFGTVSGVAAGTATVTYTRSGCYITRTVTVLAQPGAITPATTSVCLGSTVTFSSSPGAGTWTSSNTTNAPVGATTGIVTGGAAGTAIISYEHPGTGCFRTRTITVNPLPNVITGPTILCPATTVTLTTTSTGGAWSSSSTPTATISAGGVVTGVATGTTTISYTSAAGCSRTLVVTVSAAPPAVLSPLGDTVLCPGDFVTIAVSATPGVTYEWFESGTLIPGATLSTLTVGTSGSYTARVNVAAGCSTLSVPMTVSVNAATATITVPGGVTSTCAGTPLVLNANTGVGLTYQWSESGTPIVGATNSTYAVLTPGNFTVRVTNSSGCWEVSAPVAITVVPVPSMLVTASGPLSICNGSSVTLSASTGTGYTYQWYSTAGAIPGATSSSFIATLTGNYYVVISTPSGCTATSTTLPVVANPLPDVTITPGGPTIFCVGAAVSLTAASGFTYQWYKGGAAIAGATNAGYVATTSGGYRVRVTNATTGCTDMTHADTTVSVIDIVNVIPLTPARFCWGGSAMLSTNVSTLGMAIGYQWARDGGNIPGATNPNYNATIPGDYACTISVPLGCTVATSEIAVSQVPLPDPPITFTGGSVRTGNYYVTYQWYKNLLPIPGAISWSTPSTGPGNYKVQVTDTNGCQNMSATYVVTTNPTVVADINAPEVRVFPNPAGEAVYVQSSTPATVNISAVDGKILISNHALGAIDISVLAPGFYMVSVVAEDGTQIANQKLVKK
ncbi:MAG: Ig-like domain-containing protein [Taibaiella sp.]|nr:Ig-like domain-containing protein [Taibaiella sp.]